MNQSQVGITTPYELFFRMDEYWKSSSNFLPFLFPYLIGNKGLFFAYCIRAESETIQALNPEPYIALLIKLVS